MSTASIGLLVSVGIALFLTVLFRYESNRGYRIGEYARTNFDFLVLRVTHGIHGVFSFLGRDSIRQIFHYLFHTVLRFVLLLMKRGEAKVRTMMRVNKTIAKNVERESETLSKLEEVALHKIATALTEDEKRKRKAKSLQGKI